MAAGLRQAKGFESGTEAIRDGRGKQITDAFRRIVREAQDDERPLLGLRTTDAKRRLTQASRL